MKKVADDFGQLVKKDNHMLTWSPKIARADENCLPIQTYELEYRTITHDFSDGAKFVG